jgi:bifunctional UDP-N-acetylglucosamine pyrophosphorylase/glucosamine-1-phosphate N-acetyltransferase
MGELQTVILAAGQGKRMKSALPKILHTVGGLPLVAHSVRVAKSVKSAMTVLVVPPEHAAIKAALSSEKHLSFAVQAIPRGTGDALKAAMPMLKKSGETLLVLNGDMPLITSDTVKSLLVQHKKSKAAVTLLTALTDRPQGLGRILRGEKKDVLGIVEEKDATLTQKKINEINVGVYIFDATFVRSHLSKLTTKNVQGEYYLTDLVALALQAGLKAAAHILSDMTEAYGVNSQADLNLANAYFYARRRDELMADGVVMLGEAIYIDALVKVATGCHLEAPCYLKGATRLASGVHLEMGCVLQDTLVAEGAHFKAYCYTDKAKIGSECHIGPFAHLRPDTQLETKARVGNFVEIKKTKVGQGSKVNHLSYLGDALIGKGVNVGAGTITCNYDGVNKHQTILEDGVFVGSDTQFVAPVRVGKNTVIGAGTTVTQNVKAGSLVISRVPQREILDWANRSKKMVKKS